MGRFFSIQSRMASKNRNREKQSLKWTVILCAISFGLGMLFTHRIWVNPLSEDYKLYARRHLGEFEVISDDCERNKELIHDDQVIKEFNKAHEAIEYLDSSVTKLRSELPSSNNDNGDSENSTNNADIKRKKEKGIVVRFMIGHSATSNSILDRAIDSEEAQHQDFLRLTHIEGYHELTAKTKSFFTTAVERWDADFYVKVDDDVHVNLGTLAATLARHRSKPRVYIGCMKSGPVLFQKSVKYHEPEYWKFGEIGNKYFRHATGQIYALSKDLAEYISINQHILHKYANEDVSLGSWFIGLEIEHINDGGMCCGTPPRCEWREGMSPVCAASFDWTCSGICKSVERMKFVHMKCGEDASTLWNALF
ncbi:galactosyltransferase family protein [Striga asiatica]|uniref:Hexosyltransferase n=1 Tax=Striga asiatica TaxID=4170 RepID=A0A5A7Q8I2_STRAF|nr:galactosyltransferase family protein [Striga asiatica]